MALSPTLDPATVDAATAVLRANDVGESTVPARGLYPHQWNWDSALIALGWGRIDGTRAWQELRSLVGAQHAGGSIPHIAFSRGPGEYLPGPEWWGNLHGADGRATSGISQPPVAGTCARLLFDAHPDEPSAIEVVRALDAWHVQLLRDRDPDGEFGEPVVIHPWETGRDNAVEWDEALERCPVAEQPFSRADTGFVDADQRPTAEHYRRYMGLVEFAVARGWDQAELARTSPFRVLDTGFSATLVAACIDVAALASQLGETAIAERQGEMAERVARSIRDRCDGVATQAFSFDIVGSSDIERVTCGLALTALVPGMASRELSQLVTDEGALASPYGVLSTARTDPAYAARTYWRGPVWANVTWLTMLGFERAGDEFAAEQLRERLLRFATEVGMREYAEPDTGEALGAEGFGWTAALALWESGR